MKLTMESMKNAPNASGKGVVLSDVGIQLMPAAISVAQDQAAVGEDGVVEPTEGARTTAAQRRSGSGLRKADQILGTFVP